MKKSLYVVGALIAILAIAGAFFYVRNEGRARTAGETALNQFRATNALDVYKRRTELSALISSVRTVEGDAATEIQNAGLSYRAAGSGEGNESPVDAAAVPGIAMLEAAGARESCNLTGGVIPVADNPFETEILPARELLALGKIMAGKGNALVAQGLYEEAEKELLLLLSTGSHLEEDCSMISFSVGLAMEEAALEALRELYASRGDEWKTQAANAEELRAAVAARRQAMSPSPPLMEMSLTGEGLKVLGEIAEDSSLERAIRAEAIMALNSGHLFHINRIVLGPEAERKTIATNLRLDDPVLADISAGAQKSVLSMSFNDRRKSVSTVGVIQ